MRPTLHGDVQGDDLTLQFHRTTVSVLDPEIPETQSENTPTIDIIFSDRDTTHGFNLPGRLAPGGVFYFTGG